MTRRPVLLAAAAGALAGIGLFTFQYAEGLSYFSADPRACVNCHIMRPQFDSWQKASHHAAAKCVDCHLPQDGFWKYVAKADNGYRHSKGFTLQDFHEPIMITERNSRILQANCVRCHQGVVHELATATRCVHCHADAGHGERAGLGGLEKQLFRRQR